MISKLAVWQGNESVIGNLFLFLKPLFQVSTILFEITSIQHFLPTLSRWHCLFLYKGNRSFYVGILSSSVLICMYAHNPIFFNLLWIISHLHSFQELFPPRTFIISQTNCSLLLSSPYLHAFYHSPSLYTQSLTLNVTHSFHYTQAPQKKSWYLLIIFSHLFQALKSHF